MVTTSDDEREWLKTQFDVPYHFLFAGQQAGKPEGMLDYLEEDLMLWLSDTIGVLGVERAEFDGFEMLLTSVPDPSADDLADLPQVDFKRPDGTIFFENATPRFGIRFIHAFLSRFRQARPLFTVYGGVALNKFDPSLSEEEAMIQLMLDDPDFARELGFPEER
ncbi:hypothetical protein [Litoreibacter janthinus]|uniref:Uncharacterized protein n=1 Tax=Litoreibacter janthinus TaxID=670154 RepID=A0A1I6HDB6_9RHOB|nr:hypothetical protein [Litoreibacter janthinus]SFR52330.1 hypothetical protein SAMN04488002_2842 [Litoreibacter janthinus]